MVYGLLTKCVGYMGLVWAERRNNTTHSLPITRQLWVDFVQSGSFISVLSVFLLRVYSHCLFTDSVLRVIICNDIVYII